MVIHPVEYRYGSSEMRKVFERNTWVDYAKSVEYNLLRALAEKKLIPYTEEELQYVHKMFKKVDYSDVVEYEKITKHETMALVKALSEAAGEYGKYIHLGLTSNDVLDNVLMMQVRDALNILLNKLKDILLKLLDIAYRELDTPILGRTHGRAALPVTVGFKISLYIDELYRSYIRLKDDFRFIAGKIGGAVGSQVELYPYMDKIEDIILNNLNLKKATFYTQIIPRDRLAYIILDVIVLSTVLEHFANEIRHLQRSEIDEFDEGFEEEQVGSSIMPHKRNPVKSEKICGLARVTRSYASSVIENIISEHERDLRNSSFERIVVPEVFLIVDEQLETLNKILSNFKVNREKALKNIRENIPGIFSDILVQIATLRGGDRQVLHDKLRIILAVKRTTDLKEFIKAVEGDEYLSKYITMEDIEDLMSLRLFIESAVSKAKKLLESVKL
ncbi:adenylosuccinate lyase [Candidatus Geothermarchaeota archaeon]|nr:MAG: adenylosuccinate lyase [Candidatus Geothermarchaeota archaeon]RLG63098.1 MAG: adenylosuccinate lyase [Candidatus Geothermarchaeota archaeon]HEW93400.1 adenylosuccinate lyase [Thermoprotei archaeon]